MTAPEIRRYCREFWFGDSRDGQLIGGEGYYYYEMLASGEILCAYEFYETDDGEERILELADMVGVNWYQCFGFEDDEILDAISPYEFTYIQGLVKPS